ncbi:hypothetical protein [Modestobacter versicolor]|uniref:Type IV secretory pathway VirB10-like protein n=1 Tax=Modestobacter versicolor TaxID=429133 RepID=A0A839Y4F4_9ACTN|nr:hypothetical protein [Modestobacter versicolor]MBB3677625.1 type IV secretory pathway VirB10-like protein [Modestobacter versicolor]
MSKPDEQPTTVIPQQTVEQPAVSTAPATRRTGIWQHVPARIGRARTSTVVIGCLFVLLFALNAALPRDEGQTTTVTTSDGRTVEVPCSYVSCDTATPTPTPTPTPGTTAPTTTRAPATSAPSTTSRAPETTEEQEEQETTTPTTTTRAPSSSAPASSRATTTSRAPATSAEPSEEDEEPSAESSAPTS